MITDLEGEVWKDISGYEGRYMISNKGRVKSLNYKGTGKEAILKPGMNRKGYYQVQFHRAGQNKQYHPYVHKLVAEAFIPNPNKYPQVNHINEIKTDNCVSNLEWCDNRYNCNYGTKIQRAIETNNLHHGRTREKPIVQFTLDGKFVAEYKSIRECSRQTGFDARSLPNVLKGKYKHLWGYIWKYKNKEDE